MKSSTLPLVYSCSGCSSAAQLANAIALLLDRQGAAEWSCIAGVGGDVKPLVRLACSGRPIIAIDGCPLACVEHCLARHRLKPTRHYRLQEHGVRKQTHVDFDPRQAAELASVIATEIEN
ncbi:MAG: putative zinc-binding protein, partial [Burkholderiales bacterium]|nr:putative zinc-binding protein [Burkholderiales bacterium]